MLLWEDLSAPISGVEVKAPSGTRKQLRSRRLPYDTQCAALTKAGRRCRGRIRKDGDFCPFHDPGLGEERRRTNAAKGGRAHHRLSHIPGGYLRRLTDRRGVGDAMNRLYRELRLGLITTEMAGVLFGILTRLLDSGLCDAHANKLGTSGRARADRLRPKISELLTRAEQAAWRAAVGKAPASFLRNDRPLRPHGAEPSNDRLDLQPEPVGDRLPRQFG